MHPQTLDELSTEMYKQRSQDELPKRLSDIAEGKVSPLQDNLLKVGNDALKLNMLPYVMREAAFRSWLIHTRKFMRGNTPRMWKISYSGSRKCKSERNEDTRVNSLLSTQMYQRISYGRSNLEKGYESTEFR